MKSYVLKTILKYYFLKGAEVIPSKQNIRFDVFAIRTTWGIYVPDEVMELEFLR